jgi:hypothetical protein
MNTPCRYCGGLKIHDGSCVACGATIKVPTEGLDRHLEPEPTTGPGPKLLAIAGLLVVLAATGWVCAESYGHMEALDATFRIIDTREQAVIQQRIQTLDGFRQSVEAARAEAKLMRIMVASEQERRIYYLKASSKEAEAIKAGFQAQLKKQP